VLHRALEVDLAFLALAHEALELLLELGVAAAATLHGRRILEGFDGQVDLPVLLDGPDLRLDLISLAKVLVNVLDVVAVDLGDVHEPDLAVLELQEGPVGCDALYGAFDDRTDF
jgi:hypothetical protein